MKRLGGLMVSLVLVGSLMASAGIAAKDEPIIIGLITALTGPTSLWGTQERNGALLRAEEINAAGGVLGRQIKFIAYDHKGSPAEGVNAYRKLVDQDHACVVLGTHFSNISLAIAPVAEQKRVPVLGQPMEPKVTMPAPGKVNRYSFLAQPSCIEQGEMMARFALEELNAKTAAVLTDKANSYSTSQAEAFRDYFQAHGGTVVAYIEYAGGTVDFKAQLTQVKPKNPDVLYLPQYAQGGGMQVRQARELGIDAVVLGSNSLSDPPFVNACGGIEVAKGVHFMFNVDFSDPRFASFLKNYEKRFGEPVVTYHALFGYDDMTLAVTAIKNAGSTDTEKIRDAIENLKDVPILMGDGKFTMNPKTHRPINMPSWVFRWEPDGSRKPIKLTYPAEL